MIISLFLFLKENNESLSWALYDYSFPVWSYIYTDAGLYSLDGGISSLGTPIEVCLCFFKHKSPDMSACGHPNLSGQDIWQECLSLSLSVWNSLLSPLSPTPMAERRCIWDGRADSFIQPVSFTFVPPPIINRLFLWHTLFSFCPAASPSVHLPFVLSPVLFVLSLSLYGL